VVNTVLTEVEFFVLNLLPDATAPLSVLLPETRRITPRTREIAVDDVAEAIDSLERHGLVRVFARDPDREGVREATKDDRLNILSDYRRGIRDARVIRQILDRTDLWLELTEEGRRALFSDQRAEGSYSVER
jgi:hypothetical protein